MGGYVGDVTALYFLQLQTGSRDHRQLVLAGIVARRDAHACKLWS